MEKEVKKAGRKAGSRNKIQKPPGKQTSIWLGAACLGNLETLRGRTGKSNSKLICKALELAQRHAEEFQQLLTETESP